MKRLANNKGMTLVELVVAVLLLTLIVSFFCTFFAVATMGTFKANKNVTSMATARKFVDNAMISDGVPDSVPTDAAGLKVDVDGDDTVTATVQWADPDGIPAAYSAGDIIKVDVDVTRPGETVNQWEGVNDAGKALDYYEVYVLAP